MCCCLAAGVGPVQILSVDPVAGVLVLGGADVVDGSPVLDVKPYVPFSDALQQASAPDWVQVTHWLAAAAEAPPAHCTGSDNFLLPDGAGHA